MTKVDVALPKEELRTDYAGEETDDRNMCQLDSRDEVDENREINTSDGVSELEGSLDESPKSNHVPKFTKSKSKRHGKKPYDKLSSRERQRLEEKNTRRAIRLRKEMMMYGLPLGNCNMNQLSPDDQCVLNLDFMPFGHKPDSSEDIFSSQEDEEEFIERNFDDTYKAMYEEYLNRKSKRDLVDDFMDMEAKVEDLERSLHKSRLKNEFRTKVFDLDAELEKIRVFREEIEKLTLENDILRTENGNLRSRLPSNLAE